MSMRKDHGGYWHQDTEPKPIVPSHIAEAKIRADLRHLVRDTLKYTTRGRRGRGITVPAILWQVQAARRRHSESIAREAGR